MTDTELTSVIIVGLLILVWVLWMERKYHKHAHEYYKKQRDEQDKYIKELENELNDHP